ncbi:DUF4398 domain-containing protein [Gilvimarinus sp. 1_MG-2023]|uniref:DUF4398 domain-containing protein n=1 Tax=Gilvimarinus sp. 1_MG-2023 TaxID=3062638 RepID=UPI0026E31ECA|nr:DUF4398 domain-containing protein [Gilvimarinus sp. 1_MG-2023]MDO6748483.1 DUF4398 domain-containing protein [Gilvimarinus sp. 1_MG-2023]
MKSLFTVLSSVALALVLAGCATGQPKPESLLAQAQSRVEQARSVNAERHAPVVFREAQKNLKMANELISKEEYEKATSYLDRSIADSNLAIATSNAEKSEKAAQQVQKNLRALEREVK